MRRVTSTAILLAAGIVSSLYGLAACGKAPSLPKAQVPPLPEIQQPQTEVLSVTTPSIQVQGGSVVARARGLTLTVDTGHLLDIDHNFAPLGTDPDQAHDLAVIEAAVKGLFSMGYFDMLGPLTQEQVDNLMAGVAFTKPIAIESPGTGSTIWVICVLQGQDLLGAVRLLETPSGISVCDVVHATAGSGLALLLDSFPALSKNAANQATSIPSLGFSVQAEDSSPLKRVALRDVPGMAGPLSFFWLREADSAGMTISSLGQVFRYSLPRSVESLNSSGTPGYQVDLTPVGHVGVLASEREALLNR